VSFGSGSTGSGGNFGSGSTTAASGNPSWQGDGANASYSLVFDFQLTPNMTTADLDNPSSALSKLISHIFKGAANASQYVCVVNGEGATELQIQIRDDSIFVPGGDAAEAQKGFRYINLCRRSKYFSSSLANTHFVVYRRTDILPAIDNATALTGLTTFHQVRVSLSRLFLQIDR
jgi:hypothetical protein